MVMRIENPESTGTEPLDDNEQEVSPQIDAQNSPANIGGAAVHVEQCVLVLLALEMKNFYCKKSLLPAPAPRHEL